MNKPKQKKFLTILVCLMLVVTMFTMVACDKNKDDNKKPDKVANSPSFTNGNFNSVASSDKGYPYKPTNWSGSPTANVSGGSDKDNTKYEFDIKDIVSGVISLDETAYNENKNKWGNLPHFSANTNDIADDYKNDKNVLMIYSPKKAYYIFKSDSFTVTSNSYFKVSVDVRTHALNGNTDNGVTIHLHDQSNLFGVSSFTTVKSNDTWTRYSFYIRTGNTSSSLQLWLELGNHNANFDNLTTGHAFFDNITFTSLKKEDAEGNSVEYKYSDFLEETKNLDKNTSRIVDLTIPNSEFDFVTNETKYDSAPAYYYRASDLDTEKSGYGQIDLKKYDKSGDAIGIDTAVVANPGYAKNDTENGNFIYALWAKDSKIGFYTGNNSSGATQSAITFKRGSAYKVSIWVYTKNVDSGKVHLALTPKKDSFKDGVSQTIEKKDGWHEYSFIVLANQNTPAHLYFQMWLGSNEEKATGTAFFDKLSITQLDLTAKSFKEYQDEILGTNMGIGEANYADYTYNDSLKIGDNKLENPYFLDGTTTGWEVIDKSKETHIAYIPNLRIANLETELEPDLTTPYSMVDDSGIAHSNIMEIDATSPTVFGLKVTTPSALDKNTAYRFSVWIKTKDVQKTSGVVLTIKDANEDKVIYTYNMVNTTDLRESEGLNGYRELVCYIYTGFVTENVSFELTFGQGNQFTSSTLFDGTAYIANATLCVVDYDKFKGATSGGTFEKSYDFNKPATSTSIVNGQFDTYDFSQTENLPNGLDADNKFSDTKFGVPNKWDFVADSSLKDEDKVNKLGLFGGIIDKNRPDLLVNLNTALQNAGIISSSYDFTSILNTFASIDQSNEDAYNYLNENSYLMLASKEFATAETPDKTQVPNGTNFASINYTSKSNILLSAGNYYEISVLVKTVDNARASIYLKTDDTAEHPDKQFTNIKTTSADYNGWTKYTFQIKVGFSNLDAQLILCLGATDNPKDAKDADASFGGMVFFDRAIIKTIDKDTYENTLDSDTLNKINLDKDSFATTSTHSSENKNYIVPSSNAWVGNNLSSTDGNRGIITEGYNFAEFAEGYENILCGHAGSKSALVINNIVAGAYNYTSHEGKTFNKNKYYKVSVFAKTYDITPDKNAFVKLAVTGYEDDSKYKVGDNTIYFNNTEYQELSFFVKTPKDGDLTKAVKLVLGLGEEDGDKTDKYVSGFAIFDDVSIVEIDKASYESALNDENALTSAIQYDKVESTTVNPTDNPKDNADKKPAEFNWIIFTSVAFGAIIVIVVIVYLAKKYIPKHKAKKVTADEKKLDDKKNDKYKDLND